MQHDKTVEYLKRDGALAVTRGEETDLKRLVNQTWKARRVRYWRSDQRIRYHLS
jgi:hypothetical protein